MALPRLLPALLAALPNATTAVVCAITWIQPAALGDRMVVDLMLVMLLEFIILHSSAFMGSVMFGPAPRSTKIKTLMGFGLFYSVFAGAWSLAFRAWWPILVFAVLVANKILFVLLAPLPGAEQKRLIKAGWGAGVAFYLLAVGVTTMIPMPRFGITRLAAAAQHIPGSGLWVSEPHRVVAAGAIYFTALAIAQFVMHRRAHAKNRPERLTVGLTDQRIDSQKEEPVGARPSSSGRSNRR